MRYKTTKEQMEEIVKNSLSIADVCRALNISAIGGNYKTIKSKLILWDINTEHFTGAAWNIGDKFKPFGKVIPLSEILVENSTYTNNAKLKERLIKAGLKEDKCEECGLFEWRGKKLSIELHHDNGNNRDQRLENLKMLCPNCHSQTDTFRKGNNKSAVNELRKEKYNKQLEG
jgi:Zn finger protein HypA/HybF involved in hydrogenase expression